jgi:hypothetical protein
MRDQTTMKASEDKRKCGGFSSTKSKSNRNPGPGCGRGLVSAPPVFPEGKSVLRGRAFGLEAMSISAALASCEWAAGPLLHEAQGQADLAMASGGLYLDTLGNTANGSLVGQESSSSSSNQLWDISSVGFGCFKITSVASGLCLDTLGYTTNGAPAGQLASGSSYTQHWMLIGY